ERSTASPIAASQAAAGSAGAEAQRLMARRGDEQVRGEKAGEENGAGAVAGQGSAGGDERARRGRDEEGPGERVAEQLHVGEVGRRGPDEALVLEARLMVEGEI